LSLTHFFVLRCVSRQDGGQGGQNRAEVAAHPHSVPRHARKGHRAPLHRVLQQDLRPGYLRLHRLRATIVQFRDQIRQRVRLAGLQRRLGPGQSQIDA
jgi:hypothetical protein